MNDPARRAAILQPGYLPWLGFFEQASRADVFVFLDDVQYTKNDWRNRNRIKTRDGFQWLTVPVSCRFGGSILEARIAGADGWARKHLQTVRTWYGKARCFERYFGELSKILESPWTFLVDLDLELTRWLMECLGLTAEMARSSLLGVESTDKQRRLVEICRSVGCDAFYEGKSGRSYIDTELFRAEGIAVEFQDYHHPYYEQLWLEEQGFLSHLSVVDLILNHGPDSLSILTGRMVVPRPAGIEVRGCGDPQASP